MMRRSFMPVNNIQRKDVPRILCDNWLNRVALQGKKWIEMSGGGWLGAVWRASRIVPATEMSWFEDLSSKG
jgi:hypothetical protein